MHALEELRRLGFEVEALGDKVRVRHPTQNPPPDALPLLEYLRKHKAEVLTKLTVPSPDEPSDEGNANDILCEVAAEASASPPALPLGVRLVSYAPKKPPVGIESWSVVTDVEKFIQATLADLDARLNNPVAIHGGWSVWQMLDRLQQVGLTVEIEKP